ncbi:hypothetical protein RB195_012639 [Necator americanus]|uniref:DOMON domain-containing protein n=1 Tax=Necator americanus TaxID=51031 RepID=A0ABR1DRY5_NECAM
MTTFLFPLLAAFLINVRGDGEVSTKLGPTVVHIGWKVDFADQSVLFTVTQARTPLTYVIIGFSDHGFYNNSDICIYRGGKLRDGYIDGRFQIQFDRSQDCQLEKRQGNRFQFRRRFTTCDPKDFAFEPGTTQFIIAGGYEFTRDFSSSTVMKDLRYGLLIDLDADSTNSLESEGAHFKILADNALIPNVVTTYWCVIKRIPAVLSVQKHHIIQINPYIKKGNENLVHHMEIFRCETDYEEEYSGYCDGLTMSATARSCSHVIAAWAMGEGPIYFPPEAGLPLGGEYGKDYIKVEIHYNNPGLLSGVVDNSGFELVVTTELREYDAGILEIGLIYSDANSIPPGQSAFPLTGHCVADCTSRLPSGGIHIFGSQLHAHLSGRKIFTSHYRHGVKIGEINRDNHYSPHWQHIVFIRPYVHVMPGDVLSTTCVYETLSKDVMTLGGYGIEDEMCVNYVYYFPAAEVEVCKSAIDNTTLHNYFKHEHGINNWDLPIHVKYESVDWTDENALSLKELYAVAPLNMHCYRNDGSLFPNHPTNWTAVPRPRIFTAPFLKYRDDNDCPALND